jgi:hypothetical protein
VNAVLRTLLLLILGLPIVWSAQEKNASKPKKSSAATETITGCIDQSGEKYVLRSLSGAVAVVTLRGKAFSDDNFARYVGHKVTVHGTKQKEGESSVVHVTRIDDAGPGCSSR